MHIAAIKRGNPFSYAYNRFSEGVRALLLCISHLVMIARVLV